MQGPDAVVTFVCLATQPTPRRWRQQWARPIWHQCGRTSRRRRRPTSRSTSRCELRVVGFRLNGWLTGATTRSQRLHLRPRLRLNAARTCSVAVPQPLPASRVLTSGAQRLPAAWLLTVQPRILLTSHCMSTTCDALSVEHSTVRILAADLLQTEAQLADDMATHHT
jgi:hypothetical protein